MVAVWSREESLPVLHTQGTAEEDIGMVEIPEGVKNNGYVGVTCS